MSANGSRERLNNQAETLTQKSAPRASTPCDPSLPGAADCGLAVASPVGRALLGALTDAPPCAFCASEASWPRVLMPTDAATDDDAGTAVLAPA
jgi:hypothetical protein